MKTNMKGIKYANCANVFRLIYMQEAVSKQDIARELNMSLPTVSGHLATLKEENLITDNAMFQSVMGRRARAIQVNKDAFFALGVEITTSFVNLSALNLKNEVIGHRQIEKKYERSQTYIEQVRELVCQYIGELEPEKRRLTGVGISVPAIVDHRDNRILSSYVLGVEDCLFDDSMWKLDCPVRFFNSPKAAAMTELSSRNEGREDSFVYLWIGANIGSAVVYKSKRMVGNHFREGEIAHLPIVPGGKPHFCGKRGCFGAYCELGELAKYSGSSVEKFFQGLKECNGEYENIWNEYLEYLAMGINAMRTLFDLDIVLGGDLALYMEEYLGTLKEKLAGLSRFSETGDYLRLASIRKNGASIGAAQQMNTAFLIGYGVLDADGPGGL